ncbi:MAG: hypothetical protein HKN87_13430 [Saprospiraceae bacterium]|nr:hypothetical protein [Saprospiraceae bacterium]
MKPITKPFSLIQRYFFGMPMEKITVFLALVLLSLGISCNKGGDRTTHLCFTTQHHDLIIPNISIYVKYAATDFPGYEPIEQFDNTLVSDENGRVCMSNFPLGNHWFVAIGYDELIREQVIGAMMIRFDLSHLSADTILYVGEE